MPFIAAADKDAETKHTGRSLGVESSTGIRTTLIEPHSPQELSKILDLELPSNGKGRTGLLDVVKDVLKFSVNTWDQGFLDKLCVPLTRNSHIFIHTKSEIQICIDKCRTCSPLLRLLSVKLREW